MGWEESSSRSSSSNSSTSCSSRCTPTKERSLMLLHLRRSLVMAVICMVLFGFVYAFAGTGVAQLLFKNQANGSLGANGSTLIGQNWSSPKWFHGRPDDAGPYAANAKNNVSGGDNPLVANGGKG